MLSPDVGVNVQKDGMLRYELVAHSRWLSAMDIHPSKDNIVTAAEDCTMSVWQLPVAGAKVRECCPAQQCIGMTNSFATSVDAT
jgi:hypothetical protein